MSEVNLKTGKTFLERIDPPAPGYAFPSGVRRAATRTRRGAQRGTVHVTETGEELVDSSDDESASVSPRRTVVLPEEEAGASAGDAEHAPRTTLDAAHTEVYRGGADAPIEEASAAPRTPPLPPRSGDAVKADDAVPPLAAPEPRGGTPPLPPWPVNAVKANDAVPPPPAESLGGAPPLPPSSDDAVTGTPPGTPSSAEDTLCELRVQLHSLEEENLTLQAEFDGALAVIDELGATNARIEANAAAAANDAGEALEAKERELEMLAATSAAAHAATRLEVDQLQQATHNEAHASALDDERRMREIDVLTATVHRLTIDEAAAAPAAVGAVAGGGNSSVHIDRNGNVTVDGAAVGTESAELARLGSAAIAATAEVAELRAQLDAARAAGEATAAARRRDARLLADALANLEAAQAANAALAEQSAMLAVAAKASEATAAARRRDARLLADALANLEATQGANAALSEQVRYR